MELERVTIKANGPAPGDIEYNGTVYVKESKLKELKDGIRNLKTYEMESVSRGYHVDYSMVDQDYPLSSQFRGDYVETEDLEKLLKGGK